MSYYLNTEITEGERKLGFELKEIINPNDHYFGAPPTVSAIVLDLDLSHRVIKYNRPDGGFNYKLQHFGKFKSSPPDEKPKWSPADDGIYDDAIVAMQHARRFLDAHPNLFGFELHQAIGDPR